MADDHFDEPVQEELKRPMVIGIAYLAFLLVTGLLVLLIAGRLIEF
ncbi:hypothetical protein AB5I41_28125 [Sphingomonas sp. MMS24-JH45]